MSCGDVDILREVQLATEIKGCFEDGGGRHLLVSIVSSRGGALSPVGISLGSLAAAEEDRKDRVAHEPRSARAGAWENCNADPRFHIIMRRELDLLVTMRPLWCSPTQGEEHSILGRDRWFPLSSCMAVACRVTTKGLRIIQRDPDNSHRDDGGFVV